MGYKGNNPKGKGKKGGKDSNKDNTKKSKAADDDYYETPPPQPKITRPIPFKQTKDEDCLCLAVDDVENRKYFGTNLSTGHTTSHLVDYHGMVECPLCVSSEPCAALSVSCGHWACYKCILRVRFLSDDNVNAETGENEAECPICKVPFDQIVITTRPEEYGTSQKQVEDFISKIDPPLEFDPDWRVAYDTWEPPDKSSYNPTGKKGTIEVSVSSSDKKNSKNDTIEVKIPSLNIETLVNNLFAYRCWVCVSPDFKTINDLHRHMEKYHSLFFCRTCLSGRDIFLQEHMCYRTQQEVELHCKIGDTGKMDSLGGNGGSLFSDQNAENVELVPIKPHAKCDFCKPPNNYFYTHEQLYKHMNTEHHKCFLCYESYKKNEYFKDAQTLFNHYVREHKVCGHKECLVQGIFSQECVFSHDSQLHQHYTLYHANEPMVKISGGQVVDLPLSVCEPVVRDIRAANWIECTRRSAAMNGHDSNISDNDLANLSPQERPIYFLHYGRAQSSDIQIQQGILKAPGYITLPKAERKRKKDRYPDLDYGVTYQDFVPPKRFQIENMKPNKLIKDVRKLVGDSGPKNPMMVANGSIDSGDTIGNEMSSVYTKAKDYERDLQKKMESELPQNVLDLPSSSRMDTVLNKPSFLFAVDSLMQKAVGSVMVCKTKLVSLSQTASAGSSSANCKNKSTPSTNDGNSEEDSTPGGSVTGPSNSKPPNMSNINFPKMKSHVQSLNPLQLDSLSEMRNCLLSQLDTRLDTDNVTGLRPLFFRTLREQDNPSTQKDWLTWKYQGYKSLQSLSEAEAALCRIYVHFCRERDEFGYGGLDRAKEYPSLAAASGVKENDGGAVFNPEARGSGPGFSNKTNIMGLGGNTKSQKEQQQAAAAAANAQNSSNSQNTTTGGSGSGPDKSQQGESKTLNSAAILSGPPPKENIFDRSQASKWGAGNKQEQIFNNAEENFPSLGGGGPSGGGFKETPLTMAEKLKLKASQDAVKKKEKKDIEPTKKEKKFNLADSDFPDMGGGGPSGSNTTKKNNELSVNDLFGSSGGAKSTTRAPKSPRSIAMAGGSGNYTNESASSSSGTALKGIQQKHAEIARKQEEERNFGGRKLSPGAGNTGTGKGGGNTSVSPAKNGGGAMSKRGGPANPMISLKTGTAIPTTYEEEAKLKKQQELEILELQNRKDDIFDDEDDFGAGDHQGNSDDPWENDDSNHNENVTSKTKSLDDDWDTGAHTNDTDGLNAAISNTYNDFNFINEEEEEAFFASLTDKTVPTPNLNALISNNGNANAEWDAANRIQANKAYAKAKQFQPSEGLLTSEELFPTLAGGGPGASGSSGSGAPLTMMQKRKLEEERKKQEAEDARVAAEMAAQEEVAALAASKKTGKQKGRQKKTLLAWG